ncbi:MAG: golvesin C-terminal-like domain-containing protein [Pirellulales bacterium]
MLSVCPLADEQRVNTYLPGEQRLADSGNPLAARPDGGWVATWASHSQDGSDWGVYTQQFAGDGTPLGSEIRANTTISGDQEHPSVAVAPDGSSMIVWQGARQSRRSSDPEGIVGRRFDATGQPLGRDRQINVTLSGNQANPAIAALSDGSFVVVWDGKGASDNAGIFGRRYDATGSPLGGEFLINTHTSHTQERPAVAALPDGGSLVTWQSQEGEDDQTEIYAQRFDASGTRVGGEFHVNTAAEQLNEHPAIGVGPDGSFVIAWQSSDEDGGDYGIVAQRYNAAGERLGGEFAVNTFTDGAQRDPSVAFNGHGGFAIAWHGSGPGDNAGVFVREYGPDGAPLAAESLVNSTTDSAQRYAALVAAGSGYVVSWSGNGIGDTEGVFMRHLGSGPATSGISDIQGSEDDPDQVIDLWAAFEDAENADQHLTYSFTANTYRDLFASTDIDASTGQLVLRYAPNACGPAVLTVQATDPGGLYAKTTFKVAVEPVEDAPTTLGIETINVSEDAVRTVVDLASDFADIDTPSHMLRFELVGNTNPSLFKSAQLFDWSRLLVLEYAPDAFGSAELTVRVTDAGGLFVDAAATVNVAPVNDRPTAAATTTVLVRQNAAPTVLDLSGLFTDVDDAAGSLTYEVLSNDNPGLVTATIDEAQVTLAYQAGAAGAAKVVVRGTDAGGLSADHTVDLTVSRTNLAPRVRALADAPDPAIEGATLRLEALAVTDDVRVASVSFWRDANHNNIFEPAIDQRLGTDGDGADGWQLAVSSAGFGSGAQRYFVQATDDEGLTSAAATVTGTVGVEAVLDNAMLSYSETGTGWTSGPVGEGYEGGARRHAAGTGQNTARWTFEGLVRMEYSVLVTWSAETGLASNASFKIYDGDELLATVAVNQSAEPSDDYAQGTWWHDLGRYTIQHGQVTVELSDAANGTVVADAMRLVDAPPTIESLSVTAGPITRPANVTLTANTVGVSEGQSIVKVDFYRDANCNAKLDAGDQLLGTDTDSTGGWSIAVSSLSFPSGTQTYFAEATDSANQTSNVPWETNTIAGPGVYGSATAKEGSTYTLYLDPDGETITEWSINWGDGATSSVTNGSLTATHVYADGPSAFTITSSANDEAFTCNSLSVSVLNVAPYLTIDGPATVNEGAAYVLNLYSSDPGDETILRWIINWGDGNVEAIQGNPSAVTHWYADGPSTPAITAKATDEDGTYSIGGTAAGALDLSFGGSGKVTTNFFDSPDVASQLARTMAIQPDGKLIVAGDGSPGCYYLARYNTNGTLDETFADDGKLVIDSPAKGVAVQPDNKILVAGTWGNGTNTDFCLVRYDDEGNLDPTFGVNGMVVTDFSGASDYATAVTVQTNGSVLQKIVVAGFSNGDFAVARYHPNGSLDIDFGTAGKQTTSFGGNDYAYSVAVQSDGKIVLAGATSVGNDFAVARYNTDGTLDANFGTSGKQTTNFGGTDYGYSVAILPNGKIAVGGSTSVGTDFALARYNSNGSLDTSTVTNFGGLDYGYAVAAQSDNKILVAGNTSVGNDLAVARYEAGTYLNLDTTFDNDGKQTTDFGGTEYGYAVVVQPSSQNIVIAGSTSNGTNFAIARYNTGGSLDTSFGDAGDNGKQTTGFDSTEYGYAVAIQEDGKIVVAGSTSKDSDFAVARYNTDGTLDESFGTEGNGWVTVDFTGGTDVAYGVAIDPYDDDIVVVGSTTAGSNDFAIARLNSDGTLDTFFGANHNGKQLVNFQGTDVARAVAIDSEYRIVVVGSTSNGGDFAAARLDSTGVLDTSFSDNDDGMQTVDFEGTSVAVAYSVAIEPDNKIVLAGSTSTGNNFAIARLTEAGELDPNFATADPLADGKTTVNFNGTDVAYAVAIAPDNDIVLAGSTSSGSDFALARLNDAGVLDTAFGGNLDGKQTTHINGMDVAYSLAIQTDGKIVAAGYTNLNSNDFALVRYNPDGSLDSAFGTNGKVTSHLGGTDIARGIALQGMASQPDGRMVVAGYTKNDLAVVRYFPGVVAYTVNVENAAPAATLASWIPSEEPLAICVNVGQDVVLEDLATFTDPSFSGSSTFDYEIDWHYEVGAFTAETSGTATIDVPGGPREATQGSVDGRYTYTGQDTYDVAVRVKDEHNAYSNIATFELAVTFSAATVSLPAGAFSTVDGRAHVTYNIADATAASFRVGIYTSSDGSTLGTLLTSKAATVLDQGATLTFARNFVPPREEHYLVAAIIGQDNSATAIAPGSILQAAGGVYVYGTANYDTVTIDGDELTVNGVGPYDLTGAAFVQVCTYAGNDQVSSGRSLPLYAFGGAGNDTLAGGPGDDILDGGAGADILSGGDAITVGSGKNWLYGGEGNDTISGGSATNWIYGGDGDDNITGGANVDVIYGGAGSNTLHGGAGSDRLYGGDDGSSLFGDAGDDVLFGGATDDTLQGDDGDDLLVGLAGDDALYGDASSLGNDTEYGGSGINTYDDDGGADDHIDGDVTLPASIGLYQVEARAGETTETGRWVDSYGGTFDDPFPQPGNAGGGDLGGGGGGGGGCGCKTTCPMVTAKGDVNSGNNTIYSAAEDFRYGSLVNPHPVVAYNLEIVEDFAAGEYIRATLDVDELLSANTSVYYKADDLHTGDLVRIADYVDAAGLATGRYYYSFDIDEYRNGTETHRSTEEGHILIINHTESAFGNRWWRDDLDCLVLYVGDGVMLARGDGSAVWFAEDEYGGYVTPAGTESRLVKNQDGSYTVGEADGTQARFSSTGLLTTRFDPAGNRTLYAYDDYDADEVDDEIESITDSLGRETTFTYTSGLVTSMTDFVGRTYSFEYYANGFLHTLTEPDTDGDPNTHTRWHYEYYDGDTCPDGLLKTVTNPNGAAITYTYDFAGRLTGELYPNGASRTLTSRESFGLIAAGSEGRGETPNFAYVPSAVLAKDVVATRTYELDDSHTLITTTYTTDRFGNNTSEGIDRDDGYLLRTLYERDADGRVTKMTQPDPDGPSGPQSARVTQYEYDSRGNLTKSTYPDGTEETWEYDTTWNAVTEHVDAAGRTTTYQIDEDTGNVISMTRVDSVQGNVTTSYTYTDGTGQYTDLPQGLLLTETDPLGRVTQYDYGTSGNSFGRVTSITYALGTADEATVSYEYDAAGNVIAATDELGRRTEYQYDALNRLTKTTSPWPDADPDHAQLVDDGGSGFTAAGTGTWTTVSTGGFAGDTTTADYQRHDATTGGTAEWAFEGLVPGKQYEILVTWVADETYNATDAAYDLIHNSQTTALGTVDQQVSPANSAGAVQFDGHAFKSLKTFVAAASNATLKLYSNAGGRVVADAVYIVEARPVTSYEYDALGNRSAEIDALGNRTEHTFCPLGIRELKTTGPDPDGTAGSLAAPVTYYGLDKAVRQSDVTDPSGRVTLYDYDQFNRPVKTTAGQVVISNDDHENGYTESGTWSDLTVNDVGVGFNGHSHAADTNGAAETASATWTFENLIPGEEYRVFVTWTADATNNSEAAPFTVGDGANTLASGTFDQRISPAAQENSPAIDASSKTVNLKTFANLASFSAPATGTVVVKLSNHTTDPTTKHVVADAVLLVQLDPTSETTYDWAGNVASTTDALDRTTTYTYDALNRLTRIHQPDADGLTGTVGDDPITDYVYGNDGQVKEQRVRGIDGSRVTTFEYDNLGRLVETIGPWPNPGDAKLVDDDNGASGDFSISGTWTPETGGFSTDYRWHNATAGDTAEWEFSGLVVGTQYEILVTWVADATNNATNAAYDLTQGSGQPVALGTVDQKVAPEKSAGAVQFNSHAFKSLETFVATASTATVTLDSNANGRVVADAVYIVEARPVTTTGYDDNGNVAWTEDALGNRTDFAYDNRDRLVTQTDPAPAAGGDRPETTYVYNDAGQMTYVYAPGPNGARVTTYAYDGLGRTTKVTQPDPDGEGELVAPWTAYTYDGVGNVLTETDRLNGSTTYAYDNLGRLTTKTQRLTAQTNAVTSYTYYASGEMKSLTDPEENTTTWAYDYLGRTVSETNELGHARYFQYNVAGDLTRRVDRNGRVIQYVYDRLSRPTEERWYNNVGDADDNQDRQKTFTFDYNTAGEMTVVEELNAASEIAASYTYGYDELGRVTSISTEIDGLTPVVAFTQAYDALGRRTQLAATLDTTADFVTDYSFDNLGRMTQVKQTGQGGNAVAAKRVDFTYDIAGQWDTIDRYADLDGDDLVASGAYTFDETGRITGLEYTMQTGSEPAPAYTWTWDAGSRITAFTSKLDATAGQNYGTATYTNDDAGQLTDASYSNWQNAPGTEDYDYDANGNRTSVNNTTYAVGDNNQMTQAPRDAGGVYKYLYDDEGNRTMRFVDGDGNGLDDGDTDITEYFWDHRNRLIEVDHYANYADYDSIPPEPDQVVTNAYDYQNRWIKKTVVANEETRQTAFIYDGNEMALQFDRDDADSILATDLEHRYLWGAAVDQILADETFHDGSVDDVVWPLIDHLNTARDLAKYTGAHTDIPTHRVFDAFGRRTSSASEATTCLIVFTGKPLDADLELQYNVNRWYEACTGRWLSEDPIGFDFGDVNLFVYCGNRPLDYTDPVGLTQTRTTTTYTFDGKISIEFGANEIGAKEFLKDFVNRIKIAIKNMGGTTVVGTASCPPGYFRLGEYVAASNTQTSKVNQSFTLWSLWRYDAEKHKEIRGPYVGDQAPVGWQVQWRKTITLTLTKKVKTETIEPICLRIPKLPKLPKLLPTKIGCGVSAI